MIELKGLYNDDEIKLIITEEVLKSIIRVGRLENKIDHVYTRYDRAKRNEPYFTIDNFGIQDQIESGCGFDSELHEKANYFLSEELAIQEDKIQTLRRKLKRFSALNGGNEIDWKNQFDNLCIYYNKDYEKWMVSKYTMIDFEKVYFISKEVAEKAIETFKNELDEVKKYFI